MTLKSVILGAFSLAVLTAACTHTPGQSDTETVATAQTETAASEEAYAPQVVSVAPGLSMLVGRGGNIGLLSGEDGAFVIDDQYPDIASGNLQAIEEIAGGAPRFLVNTHWHGDHAGGNVAFASAGAVIVAHENVRKRISGAVETRRNGELQPTQEAAAWPIVTFADGVSFHLNDQTIEVFKVEDAHTDGDSFIYFREANVLHMGDVFFNGAFPFIDLASGGSVEGYMLAQQRAIDLADANTKIIPGHGPLGSKADLEKMHGVIGQAIAAVQSEIDAGKSLEETLAANPLAPWAEAYGQGFMNAETFTTILYAGLSQ